MNMYEPYPSSALTNTTVSDRMFDWNQLIVQPLKDIAADMIAFIPKILVALGILLIGWVLAKVLKVLVSRFLQSIGFDRFAVKIGISDLIADQEKNVPAHQWFGLLAFWVTIFVSFTVALQKLKFYVASSQLDQFFSFLFTGITLLIIFVLGMFLSFIFAKIVRSVAENLKIANPQLYVNIAKWAVMTFTFFICIFQVGVPPEALMYVLGVAYVTLCIAFVISFGIGGAGAAGKFLEKIVDKNS